VLLFKALRGAFYSGAQVRAFFFPKPTRIMDDIAILFALLFFGMLLGVITGAIAQKKGESFMAWWLFGTFLFIVALPLIIIKEPTIHRTQWVKNCPYCGTTLHSRLVKCHKCGRSLMNLSSWEKTVAEDDEVAKWAKQNDPEDSN
jgi:hypothetical protein